MDGWSDVRMALKDWNWNWIGLDIDAWIGEFHMGVSFWDLVWVWRLSFPLCAGRSGLYHRADRQSYSVGFGFMGLSNFGYQRLLLLWHLGLRRFLIFIRIPLLYLYRDQIQIDLYLLQSS